MKTVKTPDKSLEGLLTLFKNTGITSSVDFDTLDKEKTYLTGIIPENNITLIITVLTETDDFMVSVHHLAGYIGIKNVYHRDLNGIYEFNKFITEINEYMKSYSVIKYFNDKYKRTALNY
jgi:hypothetical protein